jgi:hypothetical protein
MGRREMHTKFWLETLKGRSRHSWEDNIKTDLKEMWCNDADRSDLVQDSDPWWAL